MTRTRFIRLIRLAGAALIIVIIVVYAAGRALNYAKGPAIGVAKPSNGASIYDQTVEIVGNVDRAKDLILNGDTVFIDEKGAFKETRIIFPGMNILTFVARDQFNRSATSTLTLYGTGNMPALRTETKIGTSTI